MSDYSAAIGARIGFSGAFECKDKDGNVLEVIHLSGSMPLESLGLTTDQATELLEQSNGTDHRQ